VAAPRPPASTRQPAPVWVLPPVHFGKSNEHLGFPGTVSVSTTTLRGVIAAVARQVHSLGFRQLAIFNTHGGNTAVLIYTLRELQVSLGLRLGMLQNPYRPALSPDEATFGFHAGDWETSLMLAAAPETVRMDHAVNELPARLADPGELRPEAATATFAWMSRDISQSGVMGDATAATPAKGQRWLAESSRSLADRIIQLVNTT
jgi:creatinine amidohydrolase